jgi:hypothetical protein
VFSPPPNPAPVRAPAHAKLEAHPVPQPRCSPTACHGLPRLWPPCQAHSPSFPSDIHFLSRTTNTSVLLSCAPRLPPPNPGPSSTTLFSSIFPPPNPPSSVRWVPPRRLSSPTKHSRISAASRAAATPQSPLPPPALPLRSTRTPPTPPSPPPTPPLNQGVSAPNRPFPPKPSPRYLLPPVPPLPSACPLLWGRLCWLPRGRAARGRPRLWRCCWGWARRRGTRYHGGPTAHPPHTRYRRGAAVGPPQARPHRATTQPRWLRKRPGARPGTRPG